ncbi:MAG: hypothetical protein ACE3JK_01560 [Sporolactobacillus sp.]
MTNEHELPPSVIAALQAEQDRLFYDAEQHPDTFWRESKLHGFEKALRIIGISLPYPATEHPQDLR